MARYPIFLLAFGPPIFRPVTEIGDTSQAHFDLWSIFQVGWISAITLVSILRVLQTKPILVPREVRSILKLAAFLGLLFLGSVIYSPGRIVSFEFSMLYFMTLICEFAFLVDIYRRPPDWMQCVFVLRSIALLLMTAVLFVFLLSPTMVMTVEAGAGIRLSGGTVGAMTVVCPVAAIVAAYALLNSLESRLRSVATLLMGCAGTAITQSRGTEMALLMVIAAAVIAWAKAGKRRASIVLAVLIAGMVFAVVAAAAIGGERIWSVVNRGEDAHAIATASGRTDIWGFALSYSMTHPQGMGYVAGFRSIFTHHFDLDLQHGVTHLGTSHNTYIQYLVDGGWLGAALYLAMTIGTLRLGWRSMQRDRLAAGGGDAATQHGLRCSMLLFMFCLLDGMESSLFTVPLQQSFYFQNVITTLVLGASTTMLLSRRSRSRTAAAGYGGLGNSVSRKQKLKVGATTRSHGLARP